MCGRAQGGGSRHPCGDGEVPFYPDDLLPEIQRILAILADLELRHAAERDRLGRWPGRGETKERLLLELEQSHSANREQLIVRLDALRRQARGLTPVARRSTDQRTPD
jgi:hypothetical protein